MKRFGAGTKSATYTYYTSIEPSGRRGQPFGKKNCDWATIPFPGKIKNSNFPFFLEMVAQSQKIIQKG